MGDDGHGDRQIRTRGDAGDDQADEQYGEVRREHADGGADGIQQVDPVEHQHTANLIGQTAAEQRAERDGEGQDAGKQADLGGVEAETVLPDGDGCGQADDDAGSQHGTDACGNRERHVPADSFLLLSCSIHFSFPSFEIFNETRERSRTSLLLDISSLTNSRINPCFEIFNLLFTWRVESFKTGIAIFI